MVLSDGEKMVFAAAFVQAGMGQEAKGEELASWCFRQGLKAVSSLRLCKKDKVLDSVVSSPLDRVSLTDIPDVNDMINAMLGDNQ